MWMTYVSVLEPNTCGLCESLHGTVTRYGSEEYYAYQPPLHPNCQCGWVPGGNEDGIPPVLPPGYIRPGDGRSYWERFEEAWEEENKRRVRWWWILLGVLLYYETRDPLPEVRIEGEIVIPEEVMGKEWNEMSSAERSWLAREFAYGNWAYPGDDGDVGDEPDDFE